LSSSERAGLSYGEADGDLEREGAAEEAAGAVGVVLVQPDMTKPTRQSRARYFERLTRFNVDSGPRRIIFFAMSVDVKLML
jgi:hypothetical protein